MVLVEMVGKVSCRYGVSECGGRMVVDVFFIIVILAEQLVMDDFYRGATNFLSSSIPDSKKI